MKKTVLFMVLVMAFAQMSSAQNRDGVGNSGDLISNLEGRIQSVAAMPEGEKRGANVILLISDIMAYVGEMGTELNSRFSGSASQTYVRSQAIYQQYRSWTHPAVASEVRSLRENLNAYAAAVRDISRASGELKTSVGALAAALAERGQSIKNQYAGTPLAPIATNVLDWTTVTVQSLNNYADLTAAYSAKLSQMIEITERNRDPGALISELSQLEAQLRSYEPVQGYSFAAVAQIFKGNSQSLRSQYPGLN